ncbi:MAG: transcriptional repressor [bacterium]
MITYKKVLQEAGVTPSMQRIKILEYLNNNRIHPSADTIYQALKKDMPTLSKTTVYNTLKTLVEHNILKELSLFEQEIRYEYNQNQHIHFKCIECKRVYDIDKKYKCYKNEIIEGHKVLDHQVVLKGICKHCLNKRKK